MKKPRSIPPTTQQLLRTELEQQELRFEQRFDAVVAQLQQERATAGDLRLNLQATRTQSETIRVETRATYERALQECKRLINVLVVKQQVIEQLLPFYPYPLSPELQQQIALC